MKSVIAASALLVTAVSANPLYPDRYCEIDPSLCQGGGGGTPRYVYDTETEARSNCNPFAARAAAIADATDKLEARGYDVYDCDPVYGQWYSLWGRMVRGTFYRTHSCPKNTNPNPSLNNMGAKWTVVEKCFGRRF